MDWSIGWFNFKIYVFLEIYLFIIWFSNLFDICFVSGVVLVIGDIVLNILLWFLLL